MHYSNRVSLTGKCLEFLNGSLLGDGHLTGYTKRSSAYTHSSKFEWHLKWLSNQLLNLGIEQSGKIYRDERTIRFPNGKTYYIISFRYSSKHYRELRRLHSEWYRPATERERGKGRKFFKIIPLSLKLTPLICRQWYIDDGSLGSGIILATQNFSRSEVQLLVSSLKARGFKATTRAANTVRIWTKSVRDFLDYIGPCPQGIKSIYEYKWAR